MFENYLQYRSILSNWIVT